MSFLPYGRRRHRPETAVSPAPTAHAPTPALPHSAQNDPLILAVREAKEGSKRNRLLMQQCRPELTDGYDEVLPQPLQNLGI